MTKRIFPTYSISELRSWLTDPAVNSEIKTKAAAEIEARESGLSKVSATPQAAWGTSLKFINPVTLS
jgi:hypothetical protein